MLMRSIPELLNDSSSHTSIAVSRHMKDGSPLPSSSSDSDEDIDELPFIPMPLNMDFSGSRMSLTDIQTSEQPTGKPNEKGKWSALPSQAQEAMECDPKALEKEKTEIVGNSHLQRRSSEDNDKGFSEESPSELPQKSELSRKPLKRGSSMESDRTEGVRRRGELRRGGSADSALLLRIPPEEGAGEESEDGQRVLKKAVSMELPRRSTSPGTAKMSQEDYALKLELMRQRLLRGGSVDKKMSGLRGPLLETLGMGDEKRTISSDHFTRTARLGPPPLIRAASSDFPRDEVPKPKILRKSTSFSQGDSEPIALHRRLGAPLEIPVAKIEERRLKEAISMSALTEPTLDSRPETPREPSPKPQTPASVVQESPAKTESQDSLMEKDIKSDETNTEKMEGMTADSNFDERSSTSGFSERDMSISEEPTTESENVGQRIPTPPHIAQSFKEDEKMEEDQEREKVQEENRQFVKHERVDNALESNVKETSEDVKYVTHEEELISNPLKSAEMTITTSSVMVRPTQEPFQPSSNVASAYITPSVPPQVLPDGRKSAYASIMQTILVPSLQPLNEPPLGPSSPIIVPTTTEASAASDLPSSPKPIIVSTTEHPAVYSRVASPEMVTKEPSPPKTLTQSSSQQEISAGPELEDMTSEEVFQAKFKKRESSLTRSLKFLSRLKNDDRPQVASLGSTEKLEEIYRPGPIGAPLEVASRRLEEKSKSVQDLREAEKDQGFMRRLSMRLKRTPSTEHKDEMSKEDISAGSRRRLSWTLGRRGSQEKKDTELIQMDGEGDRLMESEEKESKKPSESPVLAMRRKIESTVAGISTRIRSYSEERKTSEEKESKRTPILSMLRRSASEIRAPRVTSVPQNQLASQASNGASSESLDSVSSLKSETLKGMRQ